MTCFVERLGKPTKTHQTHPERVQRWGRRRRPGLRLFYIAQPFYTRA